MTTKWRYYIVPRASDGSDYAWDRFTNKREALAVAKQLADEDWAASIDVYAADATGEQPAYGFDPIWMWRREQAR